MQLKGKVALVTGAMGGIGGGIARRLGAAGATVIAADIAASANSEVSVNDRPQDGVSTRLVQLDQRSPESIEQCVRTIAEENGRLDILINCAAWTTRVPFPDLEALTPDVWDRVLETNLRGPFLLARACADMLKADGGGHIVNISSAAGLAPIGSNIAYAAGKAALNHLTRCLAAAMAPDVAVNCIAPGVVENTGITNQVMAPGAQRGARRQTLLGRTSQIQDIAEQALYFVTSTSVTGQIIAIDGGLLDAMRVSYGPGKGGKK